MITRTGDRYCRGVTGLVAETTSGQTPPDVTPAPQSRGDAEGLADRQLVAHAGFRRGLPGLSTTPPPTGPEDKQQPAPVVEEEEFPVDRLRSRLNESLGGRPLTVYLVLFAGAATLLLLLAVVWISAQGGGDKDELICTEIAPADARAAVFGGQVQRINILVDKDDPMQSLTGVQLRFTMARAGKRRKAPQSGTSCWASSARSTSITSTATPASVSTTRARTSRSSC